MELRRCLSLVLVTALMMAVSVEGIQLTINPITVDEKTTTLEMKCETNAPADDRVYAIKIFKSPKFDNTPPLAFVDVDNTARVDSSIQQRATASGSITSAAGSNLVLTFNNAITCNDQGDYLCEYNSRLASTRTVNRTLQATSDPNNIEMVARPTMVTYNLNETVELMCSGYVGKPVVGNWMWETRDDTFGSIWTSLRPGLTPVDEPPASSGLCQMTGRSTLTFQVRMEDDNRMYRCYFRDSLHSGNFTFQVRGTTNTPAPGGSTGANVGGIRLSMTPTTIVDGKTLSFSIRCDTGALSNDIVYTIKIFKRPSTTYLANVDVVDKTPAVDPSIQQRATATGTVTPAQGSNLVLTFNNAISCNDQGDYSCEYTSDKSSGTMRINQTLQATSDPNNIVMVARPTMFTYNLNETVELMCSGDVGKPAIGTWMWEMRDDTFGSTWTSLRPGLTPVDETPVTSGLCQMTGRSTLTIQVRMEDDNRMYRCYFRDSLHSGNFTFQVRGTTNTPAPGGSIGNNGAPFLPESLAVHHPSTDSVELSWTPGFAGGDFFQWFHVQYRRQDSQKGQWSNVSTADNRSSSDRTPVTVTVEGLQPDTSYVFRVRAQSSRPQRNLSNYTEVTGKTAPAPRNVGAVTGGVVGGYLGLVLVVVLVIVVIFKLRLKKKNAQAESSYSNLHLATRETPRDTATYEQLQGSQNPNVPQSVHSDSTYTGLDIASRGRPRDSAAYGQLQQRQHQSGAAAESASEGHYSDLDPASRVRLPEQSPYQPLAVYQNQQSVASHAQDLTSTAEYTNMP